jgi:Plasmid pRiA4b ORF-3-like protein
MARAKRSTTRVIDQIKVTLKGSKPPIWRRMQVTSATTLAQLHRILQRVMGWEGYHLYHFVVGGMEYSDPRVLEEMEGADARRVTLATVVRGEKSKFLYEYDFGDSWTHELLVGKILPQEEGKALPALPHRQTCLSPRGLRWYLGVRRLSGCHTRSAAPRARGDVGMGWGRV